MPQAWQTVRVFISSTFRDMHAERDHLVTVVFPELRERLERLGLDFFDVDLRWGVPDKTVDGAKANSWAYCKQWIDRVEPFFVCILGQRYGWTPPAEEIRDKADRHAFAGMSITEMEIRHAVLTGSIQRRSFFYFRNTPVPTSAPADIYKEFVDAADRPRLDALKDRIVKQSGRPVRPYDCHWTGNAFDDLDDFGQDVLEDLWSGVLRDERYVSKDAWQKALGHEPDGDPLYTDESRPIPREVWEKVAEHAKPAPRDPLDAEAEQMAAFAASRLRWFQGRTHELQQLTDFLRATAADAPHLAVVAAVPGQGKSALLAKLSTLIPQPTTFLITHFVGATERSATAYALVERLLGELDRSGIAWPAEQQEEGQEPKRDFNSLCLRLAQRLGDYAGERRIVILLDALNQLSDGHDLQWLPARLGPSVRVIVSCIEDAAAKADSPEQRVLYALAARQPAPLRVPLGPLTEADVRTIVVAYLKEYCHELDREHLDTLCAIEQARNPLYLLVMLNELRTLGGNDLNRIVPALIASMPQDHPDTVSLFRWVLQRLEVFGQDAVRWWCLYLAHGRVGMASHELADLLARKLGADAAATALRIERGLRRYLQRRGSQLDFFHGQLRQAVFEKYLRNNDERRVVSSELADYFWRFRLTERSATELPWQLRCAGQIDRLKDYLIDPDVLQWFLAGSREYELWSLWREFGDGYDIAGAYQAALTSYEKAGVHDEFLMPSLSRIASFLTTIGRYKDALRLSRRVADAAMGDPRGANAAISLNNMGLVLLHVGDFRAAEPLIRRALEMLEAIDGPDDLSVARVADNLAWALREKGDYDGAECLYRRGLEIHERILGADHPDTAQSLNNLSSALNARGEYAGAESVLRRALQIRRTTLGMRHPATATTLVNLGVALAAQGCLRQAEQVSKEALTIMAERLGPHHPVTVKTRAWVQGLHPSGDVAK